MRVLIAGLLGGIVFFMWGAVAHMVLPIGQMGMKEPTDQKATLAAIAPSTSGAGVYMYPSLPPEKMNDKAAVAAFAAENKGSPFAFVIYAPEGNSATADMSPNLIKQIAGDTFSALIVAFVLTLAAFGFGKRVLIAAVLGLFSWLTVSVPYWNWYLFPLDFTLGNLLEQVVGWAISGVVMAWWLGRKGG
ncbi:MAG TPA: hypothetical protein VKM35_01205 [Arenimonas sp.]|uniref:hypothetical protein n=1 Tax=Arenimonas sp. TaxID=1872635 RepID=UPI002B629341|nr:hypothetical protein [Arenimonas sp.]HMB55803.1 hypothetical protein [Arenimonas sp.]